MSPSVPASAGPDPRQLADFTAPIASGLAPVTGGGLSVERAVQLDGRLRELRASRNRAAVEIRSYPVGASS